MHKMHIFSSSDYLDSATKIRLLSIATMTEDTTRPGPGKDCIGALEDQVDGPGPVRIPHSSNCAIAIDKAMQLSPAALFMCL